jgi:hypothetical protein
VLPSAVDEVNPLRTAAAFVIAVALMRAAGSVADVDRGDQEIKLPLDTVEITQFARYTFAVPKNSSKNRFSTAVFSNNLTKRIVREERQP